MGAEAARRGGRGAGDGAGGAVGLGCRSRGGSDWSPLRPTLNPLVWGRAGFEPRGRRRRGESGRWPWWSPRHRSGASPSGTDRLPVQLHIAHPRLTRFGCRPSAKVGRPAAVSELVSVAGLGGVERKPVLRRQLRLLAEHGPAPPVRPRGSAPVRRALPGSPSPRRRTAPPPMADGIDFPVALGLVAPWVAAGLAVPAPWKEAIIVDNVVALARRISRG